MYFSLIDQEILGSDAEREVRRRVAGAYDSVGRFTPAAWVTAIVRCDIQPRGIDLEHVTEGDSSLGAVDVFVTLAQLDAAYLQGDVGKTPLGWTSFNIAPAKYTEGPPGDQLVWFGRVYEITSEEPHDEPGPLLPPARRYVATDKGAA